MRYLVWFSCGAASAVAARLAVDKYGDKCEVLYCNTLATEHPDNTRFLRDVERWIGREVKILSSNRYVDVDDVFMRTRYMAGVMGARCTVEMKKIPREQYEEEGDTHIFGYTFDEQARIDRFEKQNPNLFVEWILWDRMITKKQCYKILDLAKIELPAMYKLGFDHNNCIACVKATSPAYWNKVRTHFPEIYDKRAKQSRELGVRLVRYKGRRIFLDELPVELEQILLNQPDGDIECGPVCQTPEVG